MGLIKRQKVEKQLYNQFKEELVKEYGNDPVPTKPDVDIKHFMFYAKDMVDAYNQQMIVNGISRADFYSFVQHKLGLEVRCNDKYCGIRSHDNYITWFRNDFPRISKYSISSNDVKSNLTGEVINHGWLAILDVLEQKTKHTDIKDKFTKEFGY